MILMHPIVARVAFAAAAWAALAALASLVALASFPEAKLAAVAAFAAAAFALGVAYGISTSGGSTRAGGSPTSGGFSTLVFFSMLARHTSTLCGLCMTVSQSCLKAGLSDTSWRASPICRMKWRKTPRLMSRAENIPSIIQLSSSFDDRLLSSSSSNLSRFLERSSNNFFTADLFSDVDNDVFSLDIVFNFSPEKSDFDQ